MNVSDKANPGASVRARLSNVARKRGEDFQLVLTRYGLERFMYRISRSPYRERFVLKGVMLFTLWTDEPHRPTRDVDVLGYGDASETALRMTFREICTQPVEEDGLRFDPDSVRVEPIRDDTEYGGMRVTLLGSLDGARIPIQVDLGLGDAVTPDPDEVDYPMLLDGPASTVYSSYELRTIRALAEWQPQLAGELAALEPRLVDLLAIIRGHYYHPDFHGSYSIKQALRLKAVHTSGPSLIVTVVKVAHRKAACRGG